MTDIKGFVINETFVFNETDNLYIKLIESGIDVTPLKKQLKVISAKIHNNKIGYARLESNIGIIKIIICPKIFEYDEKLFLSYLQQAFTLIERYKSCSKYFKIDKTLLNLAIANEKDDKNALNFDSMLESKFKMSLIEINTFFKKYNKVDVFKKSYASATIENEVDIQASICDPIKSNVHQFKKLNTPETRLAEIALMVIEFFIRKNKHYLSPPLVSLARKIYTKVKQKYRVKRVKITVSKFMHDGYEKSFNTEQKKRLLNNLLVLLSQEDFFNSSKGEGKLDRYTHSCSLFFEANIIFEYLVYDFLLCSYSSEEIKIKPRSYQLLYSKDNVEIGKIKSEPDFILDLNDSMVIVDAKWKILNKLDSNFNYDVLKLKRDSQLFRADKIMLVYPKVNSEILNKSPVYFNNEPESLINIVQADVIKN
ncbi:5-methylcytosine restriction system specificity protein McrC [Pseudoalteromonas sp. SWN166]|uniref:5-methylcytosine restriction system specificity protein McrC n=1 Tax=Pseudoalteromonas sp. SWN166 TaxID=2792061 RepID=UPI0018CFC99D|nr:hypothetical protein [Pseudoalteromonas sp. SWN166]MBH0039870.1 hypothetical protein [Pseudoalteromonas sp. SWN166]